MWRCAQFRAYLVTLQRNGVVTGLGYFRGVAERRTPTLIGMFRAASAEFERTCCGHGQQVPEVATPTYAAHMSEAEALHSGVLIGIAWSVVAAGHSVGTQLHQAEGSSWAGKGLALSQFLTGAGTDQGIYKSGSFASLAKHRTRPNRCCRSDR
jgi:hypothetical protein